MKSATPAIVYLVGALLMALFYEPLKSFLGGTWLFVCAGVVYLMFLRLLGTWLARRSTPDED